MGSFVGALVWRLHTGRDFVKARSECESCHHKLSPLDLVPVFSWLLLRGKCRYCGKKIGLQALLLELTMGAVFACSYLIWPLGLGRWEVVASFALWLVFMVMLAALFVYDLKWRLLLDKLVFPLIALGFVDAGLRVAISGENYFVHVIGGAAVLGGLYAALYAMSGGKWVGFGDVKLGIFLGIVLGWEKALLVLFLANVLGFLVVVPGLMTGALTRKSQVAFGPFLIAAFVIAGLFGGTIIEWYMRSILPY